jgi:gas vesicle protein
MSTKNNVAIALAALAAGAAIGLLFAPASGKDTRAKIARKGSDLRDSLDDMLAEGGELINKMKGEVGDLAGKGKDAANTMKDRVKEGAGEMANAARSTANGGYKS